MLGNTFSTTGLFSSISRALILGKTAEIKFAGEETLHGETVYRYNFHVSPNEAGWTIHYGKEWGQAAEEGWFLVDKSTLTLRRVDVRAADVPRNLKLRGLEAIIDYEPETIGEGRILLPDMAEVHVKEGAGTERLSRMFFDHCRSFGAESAMVFDADANQQPAAKTTGNLELPSDLVVAVSLSSAISLAKAADNDVLKATVAEPVVSHGKVIIPSGAAVEGHMRSRRGENAVVIELDRVRMAGNWVPFYARLVSLVSIPQVRVENTESQKKAALADPEIPGVTKVYFANEASEMADGARMVWKTESLVAPSTAGPPQLNTSMGLR